MWEGLGLCLCYFCFALCVVVCLLAVGGIFEEVVTVRLFNLVARCKTKLKFLLKFLLIRIFEFIGIMN